MADGRALRADAVRNRLRVLEAAEQLLREAEDPSAVTMDAVAAAAGVGKGTLFRRFGDRNGLVQALYAERADLVRAALPELIASFPDPVDRAVAVLDTITVFKLDNLAVSSVLEQAGRGSPYENPTYGAWHALVREQVVAARGPAHADHFAHALLAATRSDLLGHLRGTSPSQVRADLEAFVRSCLRPDELPAGVSTPAVRPAHTGGT
ncbi:TetR/AcrR family transcriptional regulator [Auraticoccus monumenti]|uniref:TetR/AcrR family transcriptional regulator n=1 Tax=Auraticoccus monumenti TaxID=675864 RepID=UPI000A6A5A74|nr:TetR family transcriptional regulator [Auraticoccus monumenti]